MDWSFYCKRPKTMYNLKAHLYSDSPFCHCSLCQPYIIWYLIVTNGSKLFICSLNEKAAGTSSNLWYAAYLYHIALTAQSFSKSFHCLSYQDTYNLSAHSRPSDDLHIHRFVIQSLVVDERIGYPGLSHEVANMDVSFNRDTVSVHLSRKVCTVYNVFNV